MRNAYWIASAFVLIVGCSDVASPETEPVKTSAPVTQKAHGYPTQIEVVAGGNQEGPSGVLLPIPVIVRIIDGYGAPIRDWPVSIEPSTNSGQIVKSTNGGTPPVARFAHDVPNSVFYTNGDGSVEVGWMLGSAGENTLNAKALAKNLAESVAGVDVKVTAHGY